MSRKLTVIVTCAASVIAVAGAVWSRNRRSKTAESPVVHAAPKEVKEDGRPTPLLMKDVLLLKIPAEYRATAVVKVNKNKKQIDVFYGGFLFGKNHRPQEAVGHGHLAVDRWNVAHILVHRKPIEVHPSTGGAAQPRESAEVREMIEEAGVHNGFSVVTALAPRAITAGPLEVTFTNQGRVCAINKAA